MRKWSLKLLQFILRVTWMHEPDFIAIHLVVVETFYSRFNHECEPAGGTRGEVLWSRARLLICTECESSSNIRAALWERHLFIVDFDSWTHMLTDSCAHTKHTQVAFSCKQLKYFIQAMSVQVFHISSTGANGQPHVFKRHLMVICGMWGTYQKRFR